MRRKKQHKHLKHSSKNKIPHHLRTVSNISSKRTSKHEDIFTDGKHFGALVVLPDKRQAMIYRNYVNSNGEHLLFVNGEPSPRVALSKSEFTIKEYYQC